MGRSIGYVPVSALRQSKAAMIRKAQTGEGPLVVTRRGRAVAVMQSVAAYEWKERERVLLKLLVAGEGEVAAGVGHTLASVMKEADAMLVDGPV